jgi:hypothetical protein
MKREQFERSLEQSYPHITRWVKTQGWIEIGEDEYSRSFVRALDIGGMVWEGQEQSEYATIDAMLRALEEGLAEWMREHLGEGES